MGRKKPNAKGFKCLWYGYSNKIVPMLNINPGKALSTPKMSAFFKNKNKIIAGFF